VALFRRRKKSEDEAQVTKVRLRDRLARTSNGFSQSLRLAFGGTGNEAMWQGIEDALLLADVGLEATQSLVAATKKEVGRSASAAEVTSALRAKIVDLLSSHDEEISETTSEGPAVILVVGVNGTGKTTSTGKLAQRFVGEGQKVVLGAADTFRAAAADQLATWAERTGALLVRGADQGDPAAVAFDAVKTGVDSGADVVLLDTAGRLHTKSGLMDELGKVRRVVERTLPISEVLLVLDATTGQNAVVQAREFAAAVHVTGIVLTKLDGTAKGGVVIAIQQALGIPVKFIGIGEGADDLIDFDAEEFADALFSQTTI
jgi:fused signal recognition particle receptor